MEGGEWKTGKMECVLRDKGRMQGRQVCVCTSKELCLVETHNVIIAFDNNCDSANMPHGNPVGGTGHTK